MSNVPDTESTSEPPITEPTITTSGQNQIFPVVGIGASAGGLRALEQFFRHLPDETGMAFVIVQHLAPNYKSELAMLLQRHTSLEVQQITDGLAVHPNAIYVIPPGQELSLEGEVLRLTQRGPHSRSRSPIDVFFHALANELSERAVAIVLSGTGTDGTNGVKAVKENGGFTMAQEPTDAEYDGMPKSAIGTNCIDLVAPATELAERLVSYRQSVLKVQFPQLAESLANSDTDILQRILVQLRERVGHDFTNYKHSTILRRIGRRMRVQNIDDMADYLSYLRRDHQEVQALFRDFLISVTNFFRDPQAFEALEEQVMPKLFSRKQQPVEQLRIWVPGCATGEEAYSLAILLSEYAAKNEARPDIQIFATDIDREALAFAQRGFYSDAITSEVGTERLQRFFRKEAAGYRVTKEIREKILFASHNLVTDPPFSRLDFIACRNLLIYLERPLQETVFGLFHYALQPGGYLFLGSSESPDVAQDLFSAVDKKHRVFQRRDSVITEPRFLATSNRPKPRMQQPSTREEQRQQLSQVEEQYQQWRLQQYAPPALLVDNNHKIVHLFGNARRYVQMNEGPATLNVLDAILAPLRIELRTALYEAFQNQTHTVSRLQQITIDDEPVQLRFQVGPVKIQNFPDALVEVVFEEYPTSLLIPTSVESESDAEVNTLAQQLEEELVRTKERLQTTIEEYESSNEELQASNEELQSMNEELQSTTEQLETSKEELQSVNEELIVVNQELKEKIEALSQANGDLQNLMASTEIGTIFLDRELRVKRFTPRAEEVFHIMPMDVGRPFAHLSHTLQFADLEETVRTVLDRLVPKEFEVPTKDDRWYILHILPYRTLDDKIDGVVITCVDVTKLKETETALARREAQQAMIATLGRTALEGATESALLKTALDELCKHLDADYCDVWELESEGSTLTRRAVSKSDSLRRIQSSRSLTDADIEPLKNQPGEQASAVLETLTKPIVIADLATEDRFRPAKHLTDLALHSGVTLAIPGVELPFGLLGIYSSDRRNFQQEDVEFLQGIAHLLAEAIERKRAEEELHAFKAILEERVTERTAELERSNQELDSFAYVASHDLKAPLRAITYLANWTLEDAGDILPEASKEHLQKLLGRVERMQQLLEDLLIYSRADRIRHTPEAINSSELIQDALNLLSIPASFTVAVPQDGLHFRAERVPLELVLRNLVGNAIKHHHSQSGTVTIDATDQGDWVVFTVQDDGPGIATQHHERIFHMFQTLRSRDEIEGSGMGLAVVKKTVEGRGGSISLESAEGKGTLFRFTWPKQATIE